MTAMLATVRKTAATPRTAALSSTMALLNGMIYNITALVSDRCAHLLE
jgi:hypothetical protein